MKLSEMNTVQASDAILKLAAPAANIMQDDEVFAIIEKMAQSEVGSPMKFIAANLVPIVTATLKTHREDMFTIVAALTGKTVKAVEHQRFTQTITDIRESLDKELLDFFKSSAGSMQTAEDN